MSHDNFSPDAGRLGITPGQLQRLDYLMDISATADQIWSRAGGDPRCLENGKLDVTKIIPVITEPIVSLNQRKKYLPLQSARGQRA